MLCAMADVNLQVQEPPTETSPLLRPNSNHVQEQQEAAEAEEDEEEEEQQQQVPPRTLSELERALRRLDLFLTFLGFNQSSVLSCALSWIVFAIVGVAVPVVALVFSSCSDCAKYQITSFELSIVSTQAIIAAISLFCLSHNLRKHGIKKFLFVDRFNQELTHFHQQYVKQIRESLWVLCQWMFVCFLLKTAREVIRAIYVERESQWITVALLLALILSWTYVSTISLSASILFHMVCNLQIIHFDDYGRLLERESDVWMFMEEHIRLRYHLSRISHRFRIYLLLEFLVVTASQFLTLLWTTAYSGMITFINGGDFAVSTVVQVVGITICLHAATKLSNRAQGIVSIASRWHAMVTCGSNDSSHTRGNHNLSWGNLETANNVVSLYINYSESDLESLDYGGMPTHTQLASYMSTYHKRQAFVTYLQNNAGGITIFGWLCDRGLINTIFFIELSLVTFLLGKTLVFGSA